MPMTKIRERLENYQDRLHAGTADKIKPQHVEKIIGKLTVKQSEIETEMAETEKAGKRERLEHKLATVKELIEKARWLATQV
jgi:uncharacterized protein YaiL (DUF2058 family)